MNHLMIIAIALASIIAQGCVVEDTPDAPSNDLPEIDAPNNPGHDGPEADGPEGDEVEHPIGRPDQELEDGDLPTNGGRRIGEGEPEDWEEDGEGDEPELIPVPGDPGGDEDGEFGEEGEPGVAVPAGEDAEEEEAPEIRDECDPAAAQCDEGFACEELCGPSYCDDEGRCTQDCVPVYYCVEQ